MPYNLVFVTVIMWCSAVSAASSKEKLRMGASTTNSDFVLYYETLVSSIVHDSPELDIVIYPTGGFGKNIFLMNHGRLDFGGVSMDLLQDDFDRGNKNLRVLWWVNPAIQNIMVRKDKGATSLKDLEDLCFYPGVTGSATQNTMIAILLALKIRPKELYVSNSDSAIEAEKDGRCDGQVKTYTGNKIDAATKELNEEVPLWPIGYSDEEVAIIEEKLPWIKFVDVAPNIVEGAPAYKAHAVEFGFAAPASLDNELAYKIVKGMFEGLDAERLALDEGGDFDVIEHTLETEGYTLHAGAVHFYRELGMHVPARLIPPEM